MKESLYEILTAYGKKDYVPMHMPGHKRQMMEMDNPYTFDITEIDGFDNLHHAESLLKESQEFAAKICQAHETHYLINGSTGGILSAVFSAVGPGEELLMARNCHKSVYHAVELRGIKNHYLYPEMLPEGILGSVTPQMVQEAIKQHPRVRAVLLTSPTYDGVISDISEIVRIAHAHGATVIVDEAHGAHFLPNSGFPASAVSCGADVVIQSTHKTLPALTQTALIHIHQDYSGKDALGRYLGVFQTSSPSYVLMASIDLCMHWVEDQGKEAMKEYIKNLQCLRRNLRENLKHLKLIEPENVFDYDPSKILISTAECEMTGEMLHRRLLEDYQIQSEMVSAEYVLFMTSVADIPEFYQRFFKSLLEIDQFLEPVDLQKVKMPVSGEPVAVLSISEAVTKKKKQISIMDSMGEISASYILLYPPGIPLVTPGEMISERCVREILRYLEEGLEVHGLTKEKEIEVIWEESFTSWEKAPREKILYTKS